MSGENFGRDLVGVQNLLKKHSRLESELGSHQPRLEVGTQASSSHSIVLPLNQVVLVGGKELVEMVPPAASTVSDRCSQMKQLWEELTSAAQLRSVSSLSRSRPSCLNCSQCFTLHLPHSLIIPSALYTK